MELRRSTSDGKLPAPSGKTIVRTPVCSACLLDMRSASELIPKKSPLDPNDPIASPLLQVVKVGTSSLVRIEQKSMNLSNLARICETVRDFHKTGENRLISRWPCISESAVPQNAASAPVASDQP